MSGGESKFRQVMPFGRTLPIMIECVPHRMFDARPSGFQTTAWSLVLAAATNPDKDSREALERLCRIYWKPVYAFIRRYGYDRERSEDLCQGFFVALLDKNYLVGADRERGKFRSFLLTAVKNFLANEWDRAHAQKRGEHQVLISLDLEETERWYAPAAREQTTPENLFQRRWALSLLEQVMLKLRAEFVAMGKGDQFDVLSAFLNPESEEGAYEEVSAQLGASPGAVRTAVYRMRRRYRKILREEIAETVTTPEETDEEIRFLFSVLGGH
jgi:RNA polymerase sigma-70 factor (ECF subfamily)